MRVRSLELIRYGSFADRRIDFGTGGSDLHFVIGANEAGKSTMLAALGDLLFGIHERTTYGFRYPYGELRIGATLEHRGDVVEILRRKSRANSLLRADESPLPDAALQHFLGGLDRSSFERMFGLDHARLREGGRNMLEGKEDVSRVLFEAGSGMSGAGEVLKALEGEADEIFASRSQSKPLNVSLKERENALGVSRSTSVLPAGWKEITEAREQAERIHKDAIERAASLEARRSLLDRDRRVRPILAKIDERVVRLEALGALPLLPEDAAAQRERLGSSMTVIGTRLQERRERLAGEEAKLRGLPAPSVLLDRAEEIERLEEELPVHRKNLRELPVLEARVSELIGARKRALADVGLAGDVLLAPRLERQRARAAFERSGESSREAGRLRRELGARQVELRRREEQLSSRTNPQGLAELRAALDRAPREAASSLREREAQRDRLKGEVRDGLAQLAPWVGPLDGLSALVVPSSETVGDYRRRQEKLDRRRDEIVAGRQQAAEALVRAEADLIRLSEQGGDPPTPEAVRNARGVRDQAIEDLARKQGDRAVQLAATQGLVRSADTLADRREAEAQRIAEHAGLKAELARQRAMLLLLERQAGEAEAEAEALDGGWRTICEAAGLTAPLPISEMPAWLEKRKRLLADAEELAEADQAHASYVEDLSLHASAILEGLRVSSLELPDDLGFDQLVRAASARLAELAEAQQEYAVAASNVQHLRDEVAALGEAAQAAAEAEEEAGSLLVAALEPLGLSHLRGEAVALALETLETVASQDDSARGASAEVESKKQEIARFCSDVEALAAALERPRPSEAADFLSRMCVELNDAQRVEQDRVQLERSTSELEGLVAADEEELRNCRAEVDRLIEASGAGGIEELAEIIAKVDAGRQLVSELAGLRDDLAEQGDGLSEAELRAEVEGRSVDQAAAELQSVEQEKGLVIEEVSRLASLLEQARAEECSASAGMDAAEALQAAEVARASAVELAERHIRSKAAAALLRWAMNRYRETKQAPLLRRAGEILSNVTGGSFDSLVLDWGRGEQPVIVAVRASGERCAVDDMSEGTRDQLFLALRLAAIEERAAVHAMPLICDDLLITADDARAARLIGLLAELAETTQVICFTHHEHLLAVAEGSIGSARFQVHRVEPVMDQRAA